MRSITSLFRSSLTLVRCSEDTQRPGNAGPAPALAERIKPNLLVKKSRAPRQPAPRLTVMTSKRLEVLEAAQRSADLSALQARARLSSQALQAFTKLQPAQARKGLEVRATLPEAGQSPPRSLERQDARLSQRLATLQAEVARYEGLIASKRGTAHRSVIDGYENKVSELGDQIDQLVENAALSEEDAWQGSHKPRFEDRSSFEGA